MATSQGLGPLAASDTHVSIIFLWTYGFGLGATVLSLAAAVAQRNKAEDRQLEEVEQRQRSERNQLLLHERERIMREMHDGLGGQLVEELTALVQAEEVLRENYLDTFRKVEEAELAESLESAQQGGQVSVLDRAQPPSKPERSRPKLAALGLVATLALSAGVAVLLELIDPVVVSARQLEAIVDLPLLGSLPRIR